MPRVRLTCIAPDRSAVDALVMIPRQSRHGPRLRSSLRRSVRPLTFKQLSPRPIGGFGLTPGTDPPALAMPLPMLLVLFAP